MKPLRLLFVDLPLIIVFVIGHFLGYFRNPDVTTYSEDDDD